jgi:hypothetical protein
LREKHADFRVFFRFHSGRSVLFRT